MAGKIEITFENRGTLPIHFWEESMFGLRLSQYNNQMTATVVTLSGSELTSPLNGYGTDNGGGVLVVSINDAGMLPDDKFKIVLDTGGVGISVTAVYPDADDVVIDSTSVLELNTST